jgi:hypothetical protein
MTFLQRDTVLANFAVDMRRRSMSRHDEFPEGFVAGWRAVKGSFQAIFEIPSNARLLYRKAELPSGLRAGLELARIPSDKSAPAQLR